MSHIRIFILMKRRGFKEYPSTFRHQLLVIVFVLSAVLAKGQSYFKYHRLVNSAERCFFLENKIDSAYCYYDKAFAEFDFVFVKDCFMAAQIAYFNKCDKYTAYLEKGFKNGLRWQELKLSPVLKPLISDTIGFKRKFKEYPAQRRAYLRHINWHVWKRVRDDFITDQKEKLLPAEQYGPLVAKRIATLKALVDIVGFPGDRLIGISQLSMMKELGENGQDYPGGMSSPDVYNGLSEHHLFPLLIHYPCSYDVFEKNWLRFIDNGQVHPGDVALLYDNRWLKLEQWQRAQYKDFLCGYTIPKGGFRKFNFMPYPQDLKRQTVDSMRAALFINPSAVDSAKHSFGRTHGLKTEFGFWDCR